MRNSSKWNRAPSANPSETERNFFRLAAEDEGNQERAERLLGAKLDAEKMAGFDAWRATQGASK